MVSERERVCERKEREIVSLSVCFITQAELDSDDYVPEYHQLFEYVFVIGLKEGEVT